MGNRHFFMTCVAAAALGALAAGVTSESRAAEPNVPALVELSPGQIEGLQLRFVAAQATRTYLLATLPAVIAPPPNARVAVAATFPGVVLQVQAVEGDLVRKGQALATIASREILTLGADATRARADLAVAQANAERQAKLSAEGIVAGARAEEAEAALRAAQAEVNETSRMLDAVSADGVKGTYTLTAPIDGVVAAAKIETGEPIDGMTAAFVVDAADRYEVQAQIPERLVGRIETGMRVVVDGSVEARVTSAGRVIQSETRSAGLKAAIENGTGLVAGRTTMASVYGTAPEGAVRVPRAAVVQMSGAEFVFARVQGGLAVRKVETASAVGDQLVILSGLTAGENVAVSNLSELKSLALAE